MTIELSVGWLVGVALAIVIGLGVVIVLLMRFAMAQWERRLSTLEERMHAVRGKHIPELGERCAVMETRMGIQTPDEKAAVVAFPVPERRPRA